MGLDIFMEQGRTMNYQKHLLVCKKEKWNIPLYYRIGHVWIRRKKHIKSCNYKKRDLTKLNHHLKQSSSGKLYSLIEKKYPEKANHDTRQILERILESCEKCNENCIQPFISRESILEENIMFNRQIAMDHMWINGKAVLHIVDVETNYWNAIFINWKLRLDLWKGFIDCR